MLTCPVCETPFIPNYEGRRCCSSTCAKIYRGSFSKRFWFRVNKNGPTQPHMKTCCWVWVGRLETNGYARVKIEGRRKQIGVHRASWMLTNGSIPEGLQVLHRCDTRSCVRPDHLFTGTQKENLADMRAKGRDDPVRGERHGRSKVAEIDIRAIHRLWYEKKMTQRQIAEEFGLHYVYVNKVLKGHKWAHIYAELHAPLFQG